MTTTLPYPQDMTVALADVLGRPIFQTAPIAHIYRRAGHDIPTTVEAEQAFVLHRWIKLALQHGADWRTHADAEIKAFSTATK